jgi:putative alpha-1,2-mannosidase
MLKSADQIENNPLRPELKDYIEKVLLLQNNSVSTTQEYNASDYAISLLAKALGNKKKTIAFKNRYRTENYMIKFKIITPKNRDGSFHEPFDPLSGANFRKKILVYRRVMLL